MSSKKKFYLIIIIISQFFCTTLWFAGNAVMNDLILNFGFKKDALAQLTSVVQFGFISGTLVFALLSLADRIPSTWLFAISGVLASSSNFVVTLLNPSPDSQLIILILRFLTGFFLAGIYPIGMKIASDHFNKGLGKALGFLVGALVLGTALPHLITSMGSSLSWKETLYTTSSLAIMGSAIMFLLVPNIKSVKTIKKIDLSQFTKIFKNKKLRNSAFGYFGHMFELYTFWAFVPVIVSLYLRNNSDLGWSTSWVSFIIIASGCLSCALSGVLSEKIGARNSAFWFLSISGICCLVSPFSFFLPPYLFISFLIIWGMAVIADSPMFSTMVAQNADPENKGTALTLVNSIGFSTTILSIFIVGYLVNDLKLETWSFVFLAVGPMFGLFFTRKKLSN